MRLHQLGQRHIDARRSRAPGLRRGRAPRGTACPLDEPLGQVDRGRGGLVRRPPACARCRRWPWPAGRPGGQGQAHLVDGVEERLLVLLEVAVVRERQPLERGEQEPARWPISRPALPRASSAMSGFFFCGSIELPVAYASARRRKPNSSVDHSTISSPSRLRCTPSRARSNSASATKSRSLTASSEFSKRARSRGRRRRRRGRAAATSPPGRRRRAATRRPARGRRAGGRRRGPGPSRGPAGGGPAAPAGPAACGCSRAGRRRPRSSARSSRPAARRDRPATAERHASCRGAGRWPPGRCGCARCAAWRRRPAISVTRRSMAVWMSSSPARRRTSRRRAPPRPGRGRPGGCQPPAATERRPARGRARAPRPGDVVGGQPPVERQADGEGQQLLGRTLAEPAVPKGHGRRNVTGLGRPGAAQVSIPGPTGARSRRSLRGGSGRPRRRWPARSRRGCARCAGR